MAQTQRGSPGSSCRTPGRHDAVPAPRLEALVLQDLDARQGGAVLGSATQHPQHPRLTCVERHFPFLRCHPQKERLIRDPGSLPLREGPRAGFGV